MTAIVGGAIAYVVLGRRRFGGLPSLAWTLLFAGFVAYALLT